MKCPYCFIEAVKNGKKKQTGNKVDKIMRQRYKCNKCGRTFYEREDYIYPKGKNDIRVKLLGIILKFSDFAISDLNNFLGYTENSSIISDWANDLINADLSDLRIPYKKSFSYSYSSSEIESKKQRLIKGIEHCSARKGIFIALEDDCSISYIDIFDESKNEK